MGLITSGASGFVIPAQAGIHDYQQVVQQLSQRVDSTTFYHSNATMLWQAWITACAGMTSL
jgi:hypothetical protein